MKQFNLANNGKAVAVAAVTLVAVSQAALPGGEALIFSGPRSRPDPSLLSKSAKDGNDGPQKLAPINPASLIERGSGTATRDPRAERRARNARIEEKNWITFDKGELNKRDEELGAFGIQDPSLDEMPSEAEYLLDKAERAERAGQPRLHSGLSRLPGSRPEGKPPPAPSRSIDTEESEAGRSSNPGGLAAPKQGEGLGKDLDLRSLLAPGKANSLAPQDRSAVTWRDIFGGGNSPSPSAEDLARREEPPQTANGFSAPVAPGASAAAAQESFKFRTDYSTRRAEPLLPNNRPDPGFSPLAPSRSTLTPLTPPSAPTAPVVDFSRPLGGGGTFNSYNSLGRGNGYNPALPPGPPTPAYGQPPAAPATRSGSGFSTIPSRPGFGR